uniref:Uncharacterized protein n=1 Tax=Timema bartmani TaxID=61472 RepID=A0A7R9I3X8_9NEOP|nr:unnamed protein product [Timema bartmani]
MSESQDGEMPGGVIDNYYYVSWKACNAESLDWFQSKVTPLTALCQEETGSNKGKEVFQVAAAHTTARRCPIRTRMKLKAAYGRAIFGLGDDIFKVVNRQEPDTRESQMMPPSIKTAAFHLASRADISVVPITRPLLSDE